MKIMTTQPTVNIDLTEGPIRKNNICSDLFKKNTMTKIENRYIYREKNIFKHI